MLPPLLLGLFGKLHRERRVDCVGGLQSPAIRIQVNPAQLAAENLDFETVRAALSNLTVLQPKGQLYGGQQAVALQSNDQLTTAAGFEDAIVAYRDGAPIRVRDIGRAVKASQDVTIAGWVGEKPAVALAVQRAPDIRGVGGGPRISSDSE